MKNYSIKPDEALLLGIRIGSLASENELSKRYFSNKDALIAKSISFRHTLASWELTYCFFKAYTDALMTYRFGKSKFLTYFMVILHNCVVQYATSSNSMKRYYVSFDEEIGESGEMTLHDVVSSPNSLDDPRAYLDYLYEASRIGNEIKGMTPLAILVNSMRLDGMSLIEISESLGISYRQARSHSERFKKLYSKLKSESV